MGKRPTRPLMMAVFVLVLVMVLSLALSSGVTGQQGPSSEAVSQSQVVSQPVTLAASDVVAYWTPERIQSAKALDVVKAPSNMAPVVGEAVGAPGMVPPGLPEGVKASAAEEVPSAMESPIVGDAYAYPPPFTRYGVWTAYTSWPYRTEGKLFFSYNGGNYVCSASVVNSGGNGDVVYTAGHCVVEGGSVNKWHTNYMFVPAARYSGTTLVKPYGGWTARNQASITGWVNSKQYEYDLGVLVMNHINLKTISQTTGYQGFAWNQGRVKHWTQIGYPQAAPFNGKTMQLVSSSWWRDDPYPKVSTLKAMGVGNDLTGGSSGGGWFLNWGPSGGLRNGHNDFKYTNPSWPLAMFSPYYGTAANDLRVWGGTH